MNDSLTGNWGKKKRRTKKLTQSHRGDQATKIPFHRRQIFTNLIPPSRDSNPDSRQ